MNTSLLQNAVRYAPFIVAATATAFALAHGIHVGVLDEIGPGAPH